MRTAKIGDTVVTLNERDYKQLLKRFDTSKVVVDDGKDRTIGECICKWYDNPRCKGCPLDSQDIDCIDLIDYMIPGRVFLLSNNGIYASGDTARTQLDTIHDFLLRIPETRR